MVEPKLSENVKKFIFAHVDSAELLDVLLLMNSDRSKCWSADKLGEELRTSPNSAAARLLRLKHLGLVTQSDHEPPEYCCHPQTKELDQIVSELAECNRSMRHRLLQLIFSPLKQGRVIADGFLVNSKKTGKGEDNG